MQTDIQELIPEAHRDLVEAVPKGVTRSAAVGGVILGGLLGALLCMLVQGWLIPTIFVTLLVAQRIWVWRSDKSFDRCVADLSRRGFSWHIDDEHRLTKERDQAGSSHGG